MEGTGDDDIIEGYDTNDTLIGYTGDDILRGGAGDDTYVWNLGDGHDRISDGKGANVLILGNDVYCSSVKLKRDGDDLHFIIGGEGITVENWFRNPANSPLKEVRFFDGVVWKCEDILTQMGLTEEVDLIRGGPGDDELKGTFLNDRIYGGGGNDRIEGGRGDDHL